MITRQTHNDATINFRLPSKLKNQFVVRCEEQNMHYQTVLKELIKEYVDTPIKELENKKREEYLKTQRLL